jgi:hypothetical protein
MARLLTIVAEALLGRAILSNVTIYTASDWRKDERWHRKNLQIPQLKHPFLEN